MNHLTFKVVFCALLLSACGAESDSSSSSLDAGRVMTPDGEVQTSPPEPDIGETIEETDMGLSGPVDVAVPVEPEPPQEMLCDSFDQDHLYRQSAERFADYEMREMCAYRGETLLIVNTASKCGLTPQYEGLTALNDRYGPQGLTILGFLSNDFGNQAGTQDEVETCNSDYRVLFEQFTPIGVTSASSDGQDPIFRWLTNQAGLEGEIEWNFGKFLVSSDGVLLARWASALEPEDEQITTAIETVLDAQVVTE